jgi:hypothetical protein
VLTPLRSGATRRERIAPSPVEPLIGSSPGWNVSEMPLVRYFLFVGGTLLALLFVVDAYLPQPPVTEHTNTAVDLSVIRIHSDRKWPERVVFDTSLPTINPPTMTTAEAQVREPIAVADAKKIHAREAFAQLPPNSNQLQPADPRRSEPKRKRKAVAKSYVGPPTILVAQQPRFGLFGNNLW